MSVAMGSRVAGVGERVPRSPRALLPLAAIVRPAPSLLAFALDALLERREHLSLVARVVIAHRPRSPPAPPPLSRRRAAPAPATAHRLPLAAARRPTPLVLPSRGSGRLWAVFSPSSPRTPPTATPYSATMAKSGSKTSKKEVEALKAKKVEVRRPDRGDWGRAAPPLPPLPPRPRRARVRGRSFAVLR